MIMEDDLFDSAPVALVAERWDAPGRPFAAQFTGGFTSCCGEEITAGDRIRADGAGGWEHAPEDC